MKIESENIKSPQVQEPKVTYMRAFSSLEEAERFNMIENIERPDMEKFNIFCNMLKMNRIYNRAKITDITSTGK